jgi:hypothetical protein
MAWTQPLKPCVRCGCAFKIRRDNPDPPDLCKTCSPRMGPERRALYAAVQRCYNTKATGHENYAARGIGVYPGWRGIGGAERFLAHVGPRPSAQHSLDRIDNDRDYEPGNVRWATKVQQRRNTSRQERIPGVPVGTHLVDHARLAGVDPSTLRGRLARGMSLSEAIGVPKKRRA